MTRIAAPETMESCAACASYLSTTIRFARGVCEGCAHMIDAHGAGLHDAYVADPCDEDV